MGRPVRLEGLVVNDPDIEGGFLLTKFLVSCCAADGVPIQVVVQGVDGVYEDDTWVVADVQIRPSDTPLSELTGDARRVVVDLVSISIEESAPTDAYESPY